jgi:hypothetical protein
VNRLPYRLTTSEAVNSLSPTLKEFGHSDSRTGRFDAGSLILRQKT